MAQPAQDLTAASGLTALSGRPVLEVADATLKAGASLVHDWEQLRPIVRALIKKVQAEVDADDFKPGEAAKLLSTCATVVQKVGAASTGVLRASEGMSKLALLLDAGRVKRTQPAQMTEKQLAAVVLETAAKIVKKTGRCPICTPIAVSAKVTDPDARP
jgi:hypothetical protein